MDGLFAIEFVGLGGLIQDTGIGSQPQGAADVFDSVLVGHQVDDRVGGGGVQLDAVRIFIADDMAGEFHDGQLHAQT